MMLRIFSGLIIKKYLVSNHCNLFPAFTDPCDQVIE
jgi:hypothetical protein